MMVEQRGAEGGDSQGGSKQEMDGKKKKLHYEK